MGTVTPVADELYGAAYDVLMVVMREGEEMPEQTVRVAQWVIAETHKGTLNLGGLPVVDKDAA